MSKLQSFSSPSLPLRHWSRTTPASPGGASFGCRLSATALRISAPPSSSSLSSSDYNSAQKEINDEARQITSVGDLTFFSSKHTLFLVLQSAQQIPANPIIWNFSARGIKFLTQYQNWSNDEGLQSPPTTIATMLQTYLAMEHSKNR